MKNDDKKLNEKIFYEGMVALGNNKFDTLLTITEKHLLFKKKKGIFKKQYIIIKDILIDDVKIVKDKVKIDQNKNKITIHVKDEKFDFKCNNMIEAKKIVEEINLLILNENFLERASKKGIKILNVTKNTVKAAGLVALTFAGTYKVIKENKDVIKDAAKIIFFKK